MKNNPLESSNLPGPRCRSEKTFGVPYGFFDAFPDRVLDAPKPVISTQISFKRLAVAASIAVVLGTVASVYYLQWLNKQSELLTTNDFAEYLLHENADHEQLAMHLSDQQLEYDFDTDSDPYIEEYLLEQHIDINHINLEP